MTDAVDNSTELDPNKSTLQEDSNDKVNDEGSTSTLAASGDDFERQYEVVDSYRPLYDAILKGDWRSAKIFLKEHPDGLAAGISSPFMATALSVAAMEGHSSIVEKLVQVMPAEAIALPDKSGCTALLYALVDGNIKSVLAILRKDPDLAQATDSNGRTPLHNALIYASGQEEMSDRKKPKSKKAIWLLSMVTRYDQIVTFGGVEGRGLFDYLIHAGYFDVCLYLLKRYPSMTSEGSGIVHLLRALALSPSHFPSGSRLGFWERCIYSCVPVHLRSTPQYWLRKEVKKIIPNSMQFFVMRSRTNIIFQVFYWIKRMIWTILGYLFPNLKYIRYEKKKHEHAVALTNYLLKQLSQKSYVWPEPLGLLTSMRFATRNGVIEIVKTFYNHFPDMLWHWNPLIFQDSIKYRQHQIFRLFNKINGLNQRLFFRAKGNSNLYHLAAKSSPIPQLSSVSGSAFQIQRELQWFKEVEKFITPITRSTKEGGKTAWEVFVEEHKDLRERAEQWMKDTSNYCMVVAALIATIVFAGAFTLPGGNDDNGTPIFISTNSFMVFAIFDALALFSSITSILMFLSILTSRYAMEDFLRSLPRRLILGLASLFFSIATMLVAFSAALSIVLKDRWNWAYIPITLLASFPVILFGSLQLPLFIQMIQSTYGCGVFHPENIW